MKDQWYGDNRDLVKWGVLLHLARKYGAKRIIQVAYYRLSNWGSLEIDEERNIPLPCDVLTHFRDLRAVTKLTTELQIQVIDTLFWNRRLYMGEVLQKIAGCGDEPCLVFLDPDTGLAPSRARLKHVLESELREIWLQMSPRSVLVFYQHRTNRKGAPWIQPKREQFEDALGVSRGTAKVARGLQIAPDVAFFYCQKIDATAD